jgi:hypothetical protein
MRQGQNRNFMKNIFLFLFIGLFPLVSSAAHLEDVKVLNVKSGYDNFILKLRAKDAPADSFFYLEIVKSDPEAFEKMIFVTKKLTQGDKFRLDLNIPSFSISPSGSHYRSEGIIFTAPGEKEPNSTKSSKKKN